MLLEIDVVHKLVLDFPEVIYELDIINDPLVIWDSYLLCVSICRVQEGES